MKKIVYSFIMLLCFLVALFLKNGSKTEFGSIYFLIYGWVIFIPCMKEIFPKLKEIGFGTINFLQKQKKL